MAGYEPGVGPWLPEPIHPATILEREDVFNALGRAHVWWEGCQWEITDMNGGRGAILKKNGRPTLTISLSCNEAGLVSDILITLNPAKRAHLEPVDVH